MSKKIFSCISKFFIWCDVFGSKPNFTGSPYNYSICGCFTVILIIFLSVLTFALTLANMGVIRPYYDSIYMSPSEQSINLIGGETLKIAICFPPSFVNGPIFSGP